MLRRTRISIAFSILLCAGGLALPAQAALPVVDLDCGDTVDQSLELADDLLDCSGDGLRVDAANITIDLGGHVIDGTTTVDDYGINNFAGFSGVTVRNGSIRQFDIGIQVGPGGTGNRIQNVVATANLNIGLEFDDGPHRITDSVVSGNGGIGIRLGDDGNRVERTLVHGNGGDGVDLDSGDENRVIASTFSGNDGIGIFVDGDRNRIIGNTSSGNVTDGIDVNGDDNLFKKNLLLGNGEPASFENGIEVDGDDNTIAKNNATGNTGNGIFIATGTGNVLDRNTTIGNGYGIGPDGAGLGIDGPVGTTGKGNISRGNDDPTECDPTGMCVPNAGSGGQAVTCGDDVDGSLVLGNDLTDCDGPALIVKKDNVTIDLNGHRIDNLGAPETTEIGIDNSEGHDGVRVIDGEIVDFYNGIFSGASVENLVKNVVVAGSAENGIWLTGDDHVIKRNVLVSNNNFGILVQLPQNNVLKANTSVGNTFEGIKLGIGEGNTVQRNRSSANIGTGIAVDGSDDDLITKNSVIGNRTMGMFLATAEGTSITKNTVAGQQGNGIFLAAGGTLTPNRIAANRADANGYVLGVSSGSGLGIDASGATGTVGTNAARGNDDPDECDPMTLCP